MWGRGAGAGTGITPMLQVGEGGPARKRRGDRYQMGEVGMVGGIATGITPMLQVCAVRLA